MVMVSDDLTDNTRPFVGISTDDAFIPFKMDGTTIHFESQVPSTWELENCKNSQVTDGSVWNPSNVTISQLATTPSDLPLVEILTRRNLLSIYCLYMLLTNYVITKRREDTFIAEVDAVVPVDRGDEFSNDIQIFVADSKVVDLMTNQHPLPLVHTVVEAALMDGKAIASNHASYKTFQ